MDVAASRDSSCLCSVNTKGKEKVSGNILPPDHHKSRVYVKFFTPWDEAVYPVKKQLPGMHYRVYFADEEFSKDLILNHEEITTRFASLEKY